MTVTGGPEHTEPTITIPAAPAHRWAAKNRQLPVLVSLEGRAAVPVSLKTAIGVRNRARRRGDLATVDRIGDALQASGICRECGRTLKNPESVAAGIGPECGPRVRRRQQPQPPKETPTHE